MNYRNHMSKKRQAAYWKLSEEIIERREATYSNSRGIERLAGAKNSGWLRTS
jgi:hypothetical protein